MENVYENLFFSQNLKCMHTKSGFSINCETSPDLSAREDPESENVSEHTGFEIKQNLKLMINLKIPTFGHINMMKLMTQIMRVHLKIS